MSRKTIYLEWIYEVGRTNAFSASPKSRIQKEIIENVRKAIACLSEREQEFVRLFWYEGRSCREISEILGKRLNRLESFNKQIQKKLRARLSPYAEERFGVVTQSPHGCVICAHPERAAIDKILATKKEDETLRRFYRVLKNRYSIHIATPQILLGHMKYHMTEEASHDK